MTGIPSQSRKLSKEVFMPYGTSLYPSLPAICSSFSVVLLLARAQIPRPNYLLIFFDAAAAPEAGHGKEQTYPDPRATVGKHNFSISVDARAVLRCKRCGRSHLG